MFIACIGLSRGRPIETQIVFQEMFPEQMLFHIQNFGKVVALHLHIRFTYLLPGWRDVPDTLWLQGL